MKKYLFLLILPTLFLCGCVSTKKYSHLKRDYRQLTYKYEDLRFQYQDQTSRIQEVLKQNEYVKYMIINDSVITSHLDSQTLRHLTSITNGIVDSLAYQKKLLLRRWEQKERKFHKKSLFNNLKFGSILNTSIFLRNLENAKYIRSIEKKVSSKQLEEIKNIIQILSPETFRKDLTHLLNDLLLLDSEITFSTLELPPPPFTDFVEYPIKEIFPNLNSFGDIDSVLRKTLIDSGFKNRFHYFKTIDGQYVNGFAIATEFEQIDEYGNPINEKNRFNLEIIDKRSFTIFDFLLPKSRKVGKFRFFLILVSDSYLSRDGVEVKMQQLNSTFMKQPTNLHYKISDLPLKKSTKLEILVYEYECLEGSNNGYPIEIKDLNMHKHLIGSKIYTHLFENKN